MIGVLQIDGRQILVIVDISVVAKVCRLDTQFGSLVYIGPFSAENLMLVQLTNKSR